MISNSSSRIISVYSDGGCAGNPGPASWGIVIVSNGEVLQEAKGFLGQATNQVAELSAAIEGLSRTAPGTTLELVSDSQYVLKGLTEWRKGWVRRGWLNSKGEPVANQTLWQRLFALADARKVRVRWVKGHNGDTFNERCDKLANQAIAEARAAA
ncbi:ribonuclease H [Paraburkholderia sp. EG287A]|uniref:ribonuclease H n=1 Tax=Paraburkholderia sp. EG287A TaxID=3237012 RepID=UPI0034D18357